MPNHRRVGPVCTTMPITCYHCGQDLTSLPGALCNCPAAQKDLKDPETPIDYSGDDNSDCPVTTMPIICHHCGQDLTSLPGALCDCPNAKTAAGT